MDICKAFIKIDPDKICELVDINFSDPLLTSDDPDANSTSAATLTAEGPAVIRTVPLDSSPRDVSKIVSPELTMPFPDAATKCPFAAMLICPEFNSLEVEVPDKTLKSAADLNRILPAMLSMVFPATIRIPSRPIARKVVLPDLPVLC